MAIALTRFSQWMLRGDQRQKPKPIKPRRSFSSGGSPPSTNTDFPSKFPPLEKRNANPSSSSSSSSSTSSSSSRRRMRKKHSPSNDKHKRLDRDRDHDIVILPSDGGACISGSESDSSDWSIGWLEPHPHDFCTSDAESEDSFAVLVPCYRRPAPANPLLEVPTAAFRFGAGLRIPTREDFSASETESNEFLQHWLSSLASDVLV